MKVLQTLAEYMAGEFDNQAQARESPTWFVHLRLWQRPIKLFGEDLAIFAEQSNVLKLEQPYRQRLLRLQESEEGLKVQYYQFKDPNRVKGAGQQPQLLDRITDDAIELLPSCTLQVTAKSIAQGFHFIAISPPDTQCKFSLQGSTIQVSLGFEAMPDSFLSYDKGIDPETQQPIWGALMGAYEFQKVRSY
ncbi:MAG: chorismate mutase [Leptolyngbya sp. ERB_1_1]